MTFLVRPTGKHYYVMVYLKQLKTSFIRIMLSRIKDFYVMFNLVLDCTLQKEILICHSLQLKAYDNE